MIYVRIELWPRGDRARARLLTEAVIANVGGAGGHANYDVRLSHEDRGFADPARPTAEETACRGHLARFPRPSGVLRLVAAAINFALVSSQYRRDCWDE